LIELGEILTEIYKLSTNPHQPDLSGSFLYYESSEAYLF